MPDKPFAVPFRPLPVIASPVKAGRGDPSSWIALSPASPAPRNDNRKPAVLLVGHVLEPLDDLSVERLVNSDVRHRRRR